MQIGFYKQIEKKEKLPKFSNKIIAKFKTYNNKYTIPLTFENALMNTIIIGATGTGKTKAVLLPILEGVLKNNLPGLIIDIKNDFTNDIRKLAKLYNREKDLIEIGSYETATDINLINGLSREEVINLFHSILSKQFSDKDTSGGNYWFEQGFSIFEDIINIYYYIYETLKDIEEVKELIIPPSIYILTELMLDPSKAKTIYELFKAFYNKSHIEKDIKAKIEQYAFHILNEKEDPQGMKDSQLSWTRGKIILALKKFTENKYINKFSNIENNDFTLNFKNLLYKQNKIIILRFNILDGKLASLISDFIRKKMIHDIIEYNSNIPENKRKEVFMLMDEFQSIVNFEDGPYNDNEWFDKSRSFKCSQFIATQGLSSLYSVSNNIYNAKTLINNCRNKIFLNTTETELNNEFNAIKQEIPEYFKNDKSLMQLEQGEAYYIFYNKKDLKMYNFLLKLNLDTYNKILNVK